MTERPFSFVQKEFRLPRLLEVLLGIVVMLELVAPFVAKTYGVDGPSQLNMIGQFTNLVMHGDLIPRWVPGGAYGFGIGTFYFYPPVAFYLASVVRFVTGSGNVEFLYQMTGLIGTVLSFFAARPLLRLLGASKYETNIGALLYAFAPLRIAEIYSRSSISTHVAYMFVPIVWYGVAGMVLRAENKRWKWIIILGVSTGLLAISSVPLTLATAIGIALAAIISSRKLNPNIFLDALIAVMIAVGCSSFHFSAVLSAMPYAQLTDLTVVDPEFLLSDLMHGKNMPAVYHVGILYLIWVIICATFWRTKEQLSNNERFIACISIVIGAFIAILEIPPISHPLWGFVQPFKLIQGCWRFYIQFVLMSSVLVAIAKTRPMQRAAKFIAWILVGGAVIPALLIVLNIHFYSHGNGPGGDPTEYLPIYTIHAQTVGWSQLKDHAFDPVVIANLDPGETITIDSSSLLSEKLNVQFYNTKEVTFHRFYWPRWHLYSDKNSKTSEIVTSPDSLGRATATIPAGSTTLQWRLEPTTGEEAGRWISLFTAILLSVGAIWRLLFGSKEVA